MIRAAVAPPLAALLVLSGCASTMSGIGGVDGYACKAPEGALCTSVSGVYANSVAGKPRPATPLDKKSPTPGPAPYGASPIAPERPAAQASASLRSNPRLLRLWIAPWEDADGDLHEAAIVHVVVDSGRWLIEHVRPASRPRLDGVAPPVAPAPDHPPAKVPGDAPQGPSRFAPPPGSIPLGPEPNPLER
jgi:conjugal transfer pilus assembly protein TraV